MEWIEIAESAALPDGGALRIRTHLESEAVDAFVVRFDGALYAYVNRCTHREIELDLGKGAFFHPDGVRLLCRAHGAIFDVRTGGCAGGICRRGSALDPIAVEERAGRIYACAD